MGGFESGWGFAGLALATFAGALVQAATGFGFAIVSAPAFLAIIGSSAAIPLLILLHVVQSAIVVPPLWRGADRGMLGRLGIGALAGCPLGLAVLQRLDLAALKIAVGVLIVAFTILIALRERGLLVRPAGLADVQPAGTLAPLLTGAASGFMTALLVMPGPPAMLFLLGRSLSKAESRAISLSFFGVCYVMAAALNAATGTLTLAVVTAAAWLAPCVVAGTFVGNGVSARLGETTFRTTLFALLVLSGLGAIWSAGR